VAQTLLKPPKDAAKKFKEVQARLEFLRELVDAYPPSPQVGLGLEVVMPMLQHGANSSNAQTRTVAIDMWVKLHATYGRKMDAQLKAVESSKTQAIIQEAIGKGGGVEGGGGNVPAAAAPAAAAPPKAKAAAPAAKKAPAAAAGVAAKGKANASPAAPTPGLALVDDQGFIVERRVLRSCLAVCTSACRCACLPACVCAYMRTHGKQRRRSTPTSHDGARVGAHGHTPGAAQDDAEPADDAQRVQWYLKKAEAGDADAQYNLAICYDEGKGTTKDEQKAAHWCV
jgi:hypothetical protein